MTSTITDRFSLSGRTAMVTGGVGILGKHFCRGLAQAGSNVAVLDLDPKATEVFSKELASEYPIKAIGVACDVANEKDVIDAVTRVRQELGPIHILHNNAATKTDDLKSYFTDSFEFQLSDWKKVMSVNLDGMFIVARTVAKQMIADSVSGSIIQTSSIYGIMGPDSRIYDGSKYMGVQINTPAIYSASKGGVVSLSRHFATTWAQYGIRVNTLVPGGVESGQNQIFTDKYSARIPLGRMARAEEMVGPLIFLASDASSYITGQTLVVDGGLNAW